MKTLVLALSLAAVTFPAAHAQEFRQLSRIATPDASKRLPAGARAVAKAVPVPAERIEAAVRAVAGAWNTAAMEPQLADSFLDKSRLVGTMAASVPRDAALRVVAIQGSQVLAQYTMPGPNGAQELYSRVSVTVRTQVEYNDPQKGFQRLEGTNDLILLLAGSGP